MVVGPDDQQRQILFFGLQDPALDDFEKIFPLALRYFQLLVIGHNDKAAFAALEFFDVIEVDQVVMVDAEKVMS